MKKIKFVIIGCGRIGVRHAEHVSNYGELVAVCDIDHKKANSLGKKYNVLSFSDIDDLISENLNFDVASICTPNGLHADHSIKFLEDKKNVLCEKPLALTSEDCGRMIISSEQNNVRLFAVKQNRFNPPVKKVKELIESNMLGDILSIQLNCFGIETMIIIKDLGREPRN